MVPLKCDMNCAQVMRVSGCYSPLDWKALAGLAEI